MAALAWLLIPLMAAIGAGMWGSWAARNRRTGDGTELAGYAKFRAAMEKPEADQELAEGGPVLAGAAAAEPSRMHRAGSGSDPARVS
ncbi:hypothetical protein [Streptomyces boluensis]|uniref:Uncharacterized protein n=1 Tax=Streptomyces boluensis TaxID=1775135 RepID=A0A964UUB7_9ACTN|nr:hypothetical protein [Streptomyces boluensis]NBE51780.1 hypothetical protein [Streptomyces boluensis]